jgi:hypothetical protein
MHAFLREDYLNQVQRVCLTRAMQRRTPSVKLGRYFEAKKPDRQAGRPIARMGKMQNDFSGERQV